ncbi:acyloxyacyl hydrolase [Robbsia andropogonis]|uniref:acyloxyacyl hydrolase n=1 Tax=Robbsia andropogonis TaxID=28092 RepID=UPI000B021D33|nr:acyloxyacyl hydrolase [Robbsia andropogonis]MCP1120627.1 acyloxyacyl hydrolase [Robbsia andropogonis]MCP1130362.1 acyloxyacyl hydrolase [Robbsia andropogonis]
MDFKRYTKFYLVTPSFISALVFSTATQAMELDRERYLYTLSLGGGSGEKGGVPNLLVFKNSPQTRSLSIGIERSVWSVRDNITVSGASYVHTVFRRNGSFVVTGINPLINFHFFNDRLVFKIGLGAAVLSNKQVRSDVYQGSYLNFLETAELSLALHKQLSVFVRAQHASNLGFTRNNPGWNMYSVGASFKF